MTEPNLPQPETQEQPANPFRNLRELVDYVAGKSLPVLPAEEGRLTEPMPFPFLGIVGQHAGGVGAVVDVEASVVAARDVASGVAGVAGARRTLLDAAAAGGESSLTQRKPKLAWRSHGDCASV